MQAATPDTPPDTTLPPADLPSRTFTHILTFPDFGLPHDFVFSPDAKTLYVAVESHSVDLGWFLRQQLPLIAEVCGGLTLLVALVWSILLRRHPRVPGEKYCRRCNYHLAGMAAAICPECGSPLHARRATRTGRPRWRRRAGPLALLLLSFACIPPALEWVRLSWRFQFPAPEGFTDTATKYNWSRLFGNSLPVIRVVAFDVNSGRIIRRSPRTTGQFTGNMKITDDGTALYFCTQDALRRIDTRSWSLSTALAGTSTDAPASHGLLGLSPDGNKAYVHWSGTGSALFGTGKAIVRVDVRARAAEVVHRCSRESPLANSTTGGGAYLGYTLNLWMIPGEGEHFVIKNQGVLTQHFDGRTDTVSPAFPDTIIQLTFARNGVRALAQTKDHVFLTENLTRVNSSAPVFDGVGASIDAVGKFAIVISKSREPILYDLDTTRPIERFITPAKFAASHAVLAPAAQALAVSGFDSASRWWELLIVARTTPAISDR